MNEPLLVSAAEAAHALGIARSTLYRIASAKLIPSYAVGLKAGGRRFNVQEVREALRIPSAGHRRKTPAKTSPQTELVSA